MSVHIGDVGSFLGACAYRWGISPGGSQAAVSLQSTSGCDRASVSPHKGSMMTRSVRAQSSVSLFRKARFERLEDRQVLSADLGFGALPPAPAVQEFSLAITGTQVNYSPLGLPSEMKGNLYIDNGQGASATVIGTYDETLTPILMPLAPGGAPQFVGTNGVATFTFDLSLGAPMAIGSITTDDTSFIQGVGPTGLLVGSTGTIVSATGFCTGLSGGFASHSVVAMGASFDLHTSVQFTVQDPWGVSMTRTLDGLSAIDALATYTYNPPTGSGPVTHHTPSLGNHPTGAQSTGSGGELNAAIDHVFGTLDDLWANA